MSPEQFTLFYDMLERILLVLADINDKIEKPE